MHGCRSPRDGGCAGGRVRVASESPSRCAAVHGPTPRARVGDCRRYSDPGRIRRKLGAVGGSSRAPPPRPCGPSKGRVLSWACKAAAVSACCLAERQRLLPLIGRPQPGGLAKRSWGSRDRLPKQCEGRKRLADLCEMSQPGWQRHRAGCRRSPVLTLPCRCVCTSWLIKLRR